LSRLRRDKSGINWATTNRFAYAENKRIIQAEKVVARFIGQRKTAQSPPLSRLRRDKSGINWATTNKFAYAENKRIIQAEKVVARFIGQRKIAQ